MDVVARTHGTLRRLPLGLFALVLALGLWVVPARADESELAETPEVAAAEAAPEPELAAAADDEPWDEGEDPFVPEGIANADDLPWDIYTDGGADSTVEMVLDFAAIGVPEGVEPAVRVEVGQYLWDNEEMPWGESIDIEGLATYDAATRTVTVDGTKLADDGGAPLYDGIYVNAFVTWGEEGAETLRIAGAIFGVAQGNVAQARVRLVPNGRENRLYGGSTQTLAVHAENLSEAEAAGYQLVVFVGRWFGRPDFTDQSNTFPEGEAYTYDAQAGTIELNGTWAQEHDFDHVDVFALITTTDDPGEAWDAAVDIDVASFEVRMPREDYERIWDDSMLPGWDWEVYRWYNLELDTAEHPEDEDDHPDSYEVTGVTSSNPDVVSVRKEEWTNPDGEDDWNWRYRAESYGEATLTVTYLDVNGDPQSYDFTIWVNPDRYEVDLWTESGSDRALPSATVTLHANARHEADHPLDDEDRYEYAWEAQGNGSIATFTPSTQDPSTATVTFHDCWDEMWANVRPCVKVYLLDERGQRVKDDNTGEDLVVAERSINLFVCDDYHVLYPFAIDSQLALNSPLTIRPEVRHYQEGLEGGYTVIPDVTFAWDNVDDNCLTIVDNGDGSFTLTRTGTYDTNFRLVGSWQDGGEPLEKPEWYHLDRLDFGLDFADGGHTRVYTNATATLTPVADNLDALLESGCSLVWSVGVADDRGNFLYDNVTSGDAPCFTRTGNALVLDGAKMAANEAIAQNHGANVRVRLMSGDQELGDTWCWAELREAREDYEREGDRDMLPGWEQEVYRWYNLELDTPEHPDDEPDHPWNYEVTNVTSSDSSIVSVRKETWTYTDDEGEHDDWNWRFEALRYGDATLTVAYRDANGATKTYGFAVHVQDIVYRLDRWFDQGSDTCLPGQSLTVNVQAVQDREQGGGIIEGFDYAWEVLEGAEFLTGEAQANGKSLTVTFKDAPEGETDYRRGVRVHVTATKGELVLQEDFWLNCEQRYPELVLVDGAGHAVSLDGDLAEGASVTVTPKIYYHGASPEEQAITELVWHFDENFARIVDADGNEVHDSDRISTGTFTITRTGGWRSSIDLEATWHDDDFEWDGGNRQEHLSWYFQALGASKYDVWFATDAHATAYVEDDWGNKHPVVYDDNELSLTLMADSLGVDNYSIVWEVSNDYDWEHDAWNAGATLLDSGYVTDGDTITLAGGDLPNWGGYIVRAQVKRDAETLYTLAEWIERKESCTSRDLEHVWADRDVFKQPTTEEVGAKTEFCRDCGEVRVVEVPRLRINISGATVTVAKATYTGKALKPAVTVKLGGTTLKKGTDYTVKYANNVKAGTNTALATITGVGRYEGSKVVKFTIAKAKNTLVAKLVKKTQTAKIGETTKIKTAKAFKVTKNVSKGKVTYKKLTGDKKIKVSKTGAVTVAKGLKKGTYKVKVRLTAAATGNYNAATKDLVLTIKVK